MATTKKITKTELSRFASHSAVSRWWGEEMPGDVPIDEATARAVKAGEDTRPPVGSEMPGAREVTHPETKRMDTGPTPKKKNKLSVFKRQPDRKLAKTDTDDDETPISKDAKIDGGAKISNTIAKRVAQMKGPTRLH